MWAGIAIGVRESIKELNVWVESGKVALREA
jgi:hypothetical protein